VFDDRPTLDEQPVPQVAVLTDVLARLSRPVTGIPDAPEGPTRLHLVRALVAVAEVCAVRAERALGAPAGDDPAGDGSAGDGCRDTDVEDHQGQLYAASARPGADPAGLELLAGPALVRRGGGAGGTAMRRHDPDLNDQDDGVDQAGEPVSALGEVWRLTTSAAAASEGLLGILARLTVTDDATAIIAQLDVVTALLAGLGEQATRLRTEIGLDDVGAEIGRQP
jgi:hypothetical protein